MTNELPYHAVPEAFNIILDCVPNIEDAISFAALRECPLQAFSSDFDQLLGVIGDLAYCDRPGRVPIPAFIA